MNKRMGRYFLILFLLIFFATCKKPYTPAVIQAANNYLVVDGFINLNTNGITTITLSRSRNLIDTVVTIAELNAHVLIQDNSGASYNLVDTFNTGNYSSTRLTLSLVNQYRLKIITADGHQYLSDFVTGKKSPPIDSITWQQNTDVSIYVNSHDPANNTLYYKWDYIETWEHIAPVQTFWVQINGLIYSADDTNQTDSCWTTANSATIILGTSVAISQDIITRAPITTIVKDDERIKVRYSILVRQLPLTPEAYNYWLIIQKNSQQLGTLFDLQPSQLTGNIHPLTNPTEPVIGYVTAASTQQARLFIDHHQVSDWSTLINYNDCMTTEIPADTTNLLIYTYPDTSYAPWYFTGTFPRFGLKITKKQCVDCREYGGSNRRPSFW